MFNHYLCHIIFVVIILFFIHSLICIHSHFGFASGWVIVYCAKYAHLKECIPFQSFFFFYFRSTLSFAMYSISDFFFFYCMLIVLQTLASFVMLMSHLALPFIYAKPAACTGLTYTHAYTRITNCSCANCKHYIRFLDCYCFFFKFIISSGSLIYLSHCYTVVRLLFAHLLSNLYIYIYGFVYMRSSVYLRIYALLYICVEIYG